MKTHIALAAVALRTAIKYSRDWNKNSPTVQLLQSLMPNIPHQKKGYRLYVPIGNREVRHYQIPPAVYFAVNKAGFVVTDYLAKKCVKKSDVQQKNVFNIGKVIAKDEHAKAIFDNDPQLQNSSTKAFDLVLSCHPYDVIGMSTGRSWDMQSCMRLDDGRSNIGDSGMHARILKNDVAEGTIVAYAINRNDPNIANPLCRCLIKPFLSADTTDILWRRETKIYGNNVPGFSSALNRMLRKMNEKVAHGTYTKALGLYNDGVGDTYRYEGVHELSIKSEDILDADEHLWQSLEKASDEKLSDFFNTLAEVNTLVPDTVWERLHKFIEDNPKARDIASKYALRNLARYAKPMEVDFDSIENPTVWMLEHQVDLIFAVNNHDPKASAFLWKNFPEAYRDTKHALYMGKLRPPTNEEMVTFPETAALIVNAARVLQHMRIYELSFEHFVRETLHNADGLNIAEHLAGTVREGLAGVFRSMADKLAVCTAIEFPTFYFVLRNVRETLTRPALKALQRAKANRFLEGAYVKYVEDLVKYWHEREFHFDKSVVRSCLDYFESDPDDTPSIVLDNPQFLAEYSMKLLMHTTRFETTFMFETAQKMIEYDGEPLKFRTPEAMQYCNTAASIAEVLGKEIKFEYTYKPKGLDLLDGNEMMIYGLVHRWPSIDLFALGLGKFVFDFWPTRKSLENIGSFKFTGLQDAYTPYTNLLNRLVNELPYTIDKEDKARALEQTMLVKAARHALPLMRKNIEEGFQNSEEELKEFNQRFGSNGQVSYAKYKGLLLSSIYKAQDAIEELT